MGSNLPLVSIITPSYNRASFLQETIESVLCQDYPNIEYIVLDDGSKDNTIEVLEKYTGCIYWESHPNMGETRTVNKGFNLSKGEIVCIVNSDDPLYVNTAVRTAVEFMQARPDVLVAYPNWVKIGPNSEWIEDVFLPEFDYIYMVRQHHCIVGPGAFIRRDAIELSGGRDPAFKYVGDYEFWLRVGLYGPFGRIPERLATYRLHPDSATKSLTGKTMANEHLQLINKFYSLPNIPPDVQQVKREAFGWANFVAAQFARPNRWLIRKHFATFIAMHPKVLREKELKWARNIALKGLLLGEVESPI